MPRLFLAINYRLLIMFVASKNLSATWMLAKVLISLCYSKKKLVPEELIMLIEGTTARDANARCYKNVFGSDSSGGQK